MRHLASYLTECRQLVNRSACRVFRNIVPGQELVTTVEKFVEGKGLVVILPSFGNTPEDGTKLRGTVQLPPSVTSLQPYVKEGDSLLCAVVHVCPGPRLNDPTPQQILLAIAEETNPFVTSKKRRNLSYKQRRKGRRLVSFPEFLCLAVFIRAFCCF